MARPPKGHSLTKARLSQHGIAFDTQSSTEVRYVEERIRQAQLAAALRSNNLQSPAAQPTSRISTATGQNSGQLNVADVAALLDGAEHLGASEASDHWPCARFIIDGLVAGAAGLSAQDQTNIADRAAAAAAQMLDRKIKRQNKALVKRLTRQGKRGSDIEEVVSVRELVVPKI